jgi:hypothetical protein
MENMGTSAGTRVSRAIGGTPSPVAGIFCTPACGTAYESTQFLFRQSHATNLCEEAVACRPRRVASHPSPNLLPALPAPTALPAPASPPALPAPAALPVHSPGSSGTSSFSSSRMPTAPIAVNCILSYTCNLLSPSGSSACLAAVSIHCATGWMGGFRAARISAMVAQTLSCALLQVVERAAVLASFHRRAIAPCKETLSEFLEVYQLPHSSFGYSTRSTPAAAAAISSSGCSSSKVSRASLARRMSSSSCRCTSAVRYCALASSRCILCTLCAWLSIFSLGSANTLASRSLFL